MKEKGRWFNRMGAFLSWKFGLWMGVAMSGWLVSRDAFPELDPSLFWFVPGALWLTGAICCFSEAKDARLEASRLERCAMGEGLCPACGLPGRQYVPSRDQAIVPGSWKCLTYDCRVMDFWDIKSSASKGGET